MTSMIDPKAARIEGARIFLRPLTADDCGERYVRWLQDPDVYRFLETRHSPQTRESVLGFVTAVNAKSNEHLYGVFQRLDGQHIGNIKIGPIGSVHPIADITLLLGERSVWGKGYGSEAIRTASQFAFEALGMKKLTASMYSDNLGSYHAFLKAGFKHEGRRRKHLHLDGVMVDMLEVGLTPDDLV